MMLMQSITQTMATREELVAAEPVLEVLLLNVDADTLTIALNLANKVVPLASVLLALRQLRKNRDRRVDGGVFPSSFVALGNDL